MAIPNSPNISDHNPKSFTHIFSYYSPNSPKVSHRHRLQWIKGPPLPLPQRPLHIARVGLGAGIRQPRQGAQRSGGAGVCNGGDVGEGRGKMGKPWENMGKMVS